MVKKNTLSTFLYCWLKTSQTTTWHLCNPVELWDIYHIHWCMISFIHSTTAFFWSEQNSISFKSSHSAGFQVEIVLHATTRNCTAIPQCFNQFPYIFWMFGATPQKKTVSGKHPHILNIIIVYICILCRCHGYCHLFKAIYIDIQKHTIWLTVSSNMRSEHEWTMKSSSHINQCIENKLVRFEPPIWKNLVKFDHFPE